MTRCDDGCGRYACKTWDSDRKAEGDPRKRFKALCGYCWTFRHATKVVTVLSVGTTPSADAVGQRSASPHLSTRV